MRRAFLTNLAFVFVLNLIVKPAYLLGVEVAVQNRLGAQIYGLYFALLNTAFLLQIINDFGFQIFNNRLVSIDRKEAHALFPGFILLKTLFGLTYLLLLVVLGFSLGQTEFLPILLLIGLNLVLTSFILFFRSGISGLGYYRIDSALSVLDKIFMFFLIGGMLIFSSDRFSIYHFVLGQTVALMFTLCISVYLLSRYTSLSVSWIPFARLRHLVVKAWPYALAVFLMTLYTRLDGVMIEGLLTDGAYQAGVYAAGYRILDALNMVAFLFAALLLPMFSKAQTSILQLKKLLDEGYRYMWWIVVPGSSFCAVYAEAILKMLYSQADASWGVVFSYLILGFVLSGMMYIFGTLLTAIGRVRSMNAVFVVTVVLNVLLNFLLIPTYKASGAALATLITQFFAVGGIIYICLRVIPFSASWQYTLRIVGFTCTVVVSSFVLAHYMPDSFFKALIVYMALVALSGFVFRIIRPKEFAFVINDSLPG